MKKYYYLTLAFIWHYTWVFTNITFWWICEFESFAENKASHYSNKYHHPNNKQ